MSLCSGVFIVSAKRTPFGTYGGVLKDHSATDLAEHASKAALAAGNVAPELVNSVIMGNVMQVREWLTPLNFTSFTGGLQHGFHHIRFSYTFGLTFYIHLQTSFLIMLWLLFQSELFCTYCTMQRLKILWISFMQSSADAPYIARHVGLRSGIPIPVPALTVNRLCGSGFQSIINGAQARARLNRNSPIISTCK